MTFQTACPQRPRLQGAGGRARNGLGVELRQPQRRPLQQRAVHHAGGACPGAAIGEGISFPACIISPLDFL